MSRRHLGVAFLAAAVMLVLAPAGPASAGYLYDNWTSAQKVTDPTGDTNYGAYAGRDIVASYQAYDAGYLYFRIDLLSAPSASAGYANTYGIYIDSKAGAGASNKYVPGTLTGIDFIISSQVELEKHDRLELDWDKQYQVWKVDEFKDSDNLEFQHVENGGTTLEWRVKDGRGDRHIGDSFTWWAATMLPADGHHGKRTYDMAGPVVIPIPGAVWLLGSGLLAFVGLKRRSRKNDR